MIEITVSDGLQHNQDMLKIIGKGKVVQKINVRAMNRAITAARAEVSKEVRKKYMVSAKAVKKTLTIKKANFSNTSGKVISKGSPLSLKSFSVHASKRGISVKVRKNGKRKVIKSAFYTKSTRSSWTGYVIRTEGSHRYPIKPMYSLSIPQMINNDDIKKAMEERATKVFSERLNHEIDRYFQKYKG